MKCCICEKEKAGLHVKNKFNGNMMCARCALDFKIIDEETFNEINPIEEAIYVCEECTKMS
ncbi:MAG: hypothetical protein ACRDB9_10230 [Cetobacterium sp.]